MEHRVIDIINTAVADTRLFMDPNPAKTVLQRLGEAGYVIRDARESRRMITWNRIGPMPLDVNMTFEEEALINIRDQIQQGHLTFSCAMVPAWTEPHKLVERRRASLLVL